MKPLISYRDRPACSKICVPGLGTFYKQSIFEPGKLQCANACGFFQWRRLWARRNDIGAPIHGAKGNGPSAGATEAVLGVCRRGWTARFAKSQIRGLFPRRRDFTSDAASDSEQSFRGRCFVRRAEYHPPSFRCAWRHSTQASRALSQDSRQQIDTSPWS